MKISGLSPDAWIASVAGLTDERQLIDAGLVLRDATDKVRLRLDAYFAWLQDPANQDHPEFAEREERYDALRIAYEGMFTALAGALTELHQRWGTRVTGETFAQADMGLTAGGSRRDG